MRVQLLVPAAGSGERLGETVPKALVRLGELPLIGLTLQRLLALECVAPPVVTAPKSHLPRFQAELAHHLPDLRPRLLAGGATRQESVALGLAALDASTEIVVIHDAARPFVPIAAVRASIEAAAEHGASTVAFPCIDTILIGDADAFLDSTPERRRMWACQTPQTFRVEVIREAHAHAARDGFVGTDDASLVRRMGKRVKLVQGSAWNLKITTPQDLALARLLLREGLV